MIKAIKQIPLILIIFSLNVFELIGQDLNRIILTSRIYSATERRGVKGCQILIANSPLKTVTKQKGYYEIRTDITDIKEIIVVVCDGRHTTQFRKYNISTIKNSLSESGVCILPTRPHIQYPSINIGRKTVYIKGLVKDKKNMNNIKNINILNSLDNLNKSKNTKNGIFYISYEKLKKDESIELLIRSPNYCPHYLNVPTAGYYHKDTINVGSIEMLPILRDSIKIKTKPKNAKIFINDNYVGNTGSNVDISKYLYLDYNHKVCLRKDIYWYDCFYINFLKDSRREFNINLKNFWPKNNILNNDKYAFFNELHFQYEVPYDLDINKLNYYLQINCNNKIFPLKNKNNWLIDSYPNISFPNIYKDNLIIKNGRKWHIGKFYLRIDSLSLLVGSKNIHSKIKYIIRHKPLEITNNINYPFKKPLMAEYQYMPRLMSKYKISVHWENKKLICTPHDKNIKKSNLFNSYFIVNLMTRIKQWYKGNYTQPQYSYWWRLGVLFSEKELIKNINRNEGNVKRLSGFEIGCNFFNYNLFKYLNWGYFFDIYYRIFNNDFYGSDQFDTNLKFGISSKSLKNKFTGNIFVFLNLINSLKYKNNNYQCAQYFFIGYGAFIEYSFEPFDLNLSFMKANSFDKYKYNQFNIGFSINITNLLI